MFGLLSLVVGIAALILIASHWDLIDAAFVRLLT